MSLKTDELGIPSSFAMARPEYPSFRNLATSLRCMPSVGRRPSLTPRAVWFGLRARSPGWAGSSATKPSWTRSWCLPRSRSCRAESTSLAFRRSTSTTSLLTKYHHAAADSYRRILDTIDPHFLLGLTATPDRADSADILGLFNDLVAFSAGIARGVELERLVPFHYFGVKDEIDYENIPWRNRRFDAEALATAAQTEARMQTLWRAWQEHPGTRSLVFCCSITHAIFVREWLRERGVDVAAVFAAEGSDNRETALARLSKGELDAVCAVDVFNEGIDAPAIDRVVMLRPTESSVVFLQQLGRGLRATEGKTAVTVIDFVGNHRIFLERLRALLSLATNATGASVRELLEGSGIEELPAGCTVDLELEAKQLLSRLFRVGGVDEVERAYRELALERGVREDPTVPTAGELHRMGYLPPAEFTHPRTPAGLEANRSEPQLPSRLCLVPLW